LKKITTHSIAVITKTELKLALKIDDAFTADDDYLDILIVSAGRLFEKRTNLALLDATVEEYFDKFHRTFELTMTPLQSLTTIEIRDGGSYSTWTHASNVVEDDASKPARIHVFDTISSPTVDNEANCVKITYIAGETDIADVEPLIKQAVLNIAVDMYQNREDPVRERKTAVDRIISDYRVRSFA